MNKFFNNFWHPLSTVVTKNLDNPTTLKAVTSIMVDPQV